MGGVAAGVAVAYGIRPLRRLRRDPLSSNAISLATPFVAYLLGEAVHVSGVLAVVVAGLVIGHNTRAGRRAPAGCRPTPCGGWSTSCSRASSSC